jgi:peptide/nickel transport system permease protein
MFFYTIRRILYAVPIALCVSLVCFMLVHIAPGDPIDAILPPDASAETVALVRKDYGLDKPLPVQFGLWLQHVVQGDFGQSLANRRPVWNEMKDAAGRTFILASSAALVGFAIGSVLGGLAGVFRGRLIDRWAVGFAVGGISVPHYWLGMVFVIIFSVVLGWLPAIGAGPGDWQWNWLHIRHLILPALTLSMIPAGLVTRTVRGVVVEILSQDYITTLRGKGLRGLMLAIHVIKNAAPTSIAVMGLQLGYLMGGSILVETVFAWPGTGMLLNQAIFQRDIPILQGTTLVLSMIFVTLNLLVDLVQTALDPRMRRS